MLTRLTKFLRDNKFFILIIILAVGLRFAYLKSVPPALNWDEVSHGYNAYSILKTGKDEWGVSFPTIFRAYGDYKLPVYIYLTAISEAFLGLNVYSVRLVSVLAGITVVIFTYLLVKRLFGPKIAALASLLIAIEPWSLFLSMGAFEANLALAFIVSGIYFFVAGIDRPNRLTVSSLLLGLSLWSYNSARIFVPLFLLFMVFLYKKDLQKIYKKKKATIHISLFIILVFFLPMIWQLISPIGQARYGRVAILDEGAISQINQNRNNTNLNSTLARLVYNKGTYFVGAFGINYISHFSPGYLFLRGGTNFQFSVPGSGILYPINALFLFLGVYFLVKKKTRESFVILGWILLGPVASGLTREAPHVLRSITMLPAPMVITAVGFVQAWRWLRDNKKISAILFLGVYLTTLFFYLENYRQDVLFRYQKDYSWAWQYGYKQVVDYAKENYEKYDKIIVTKKYGEPHEFFLFFWPWDPESYMNDPSLNRFNQSNWYWVDGFDKFFFVNDWQINEEGTGVYLFNLESRGVVDCLIDKCLLITSPGNAPVEWEKLETINFLNSEPAFELYENN